MATPPGVSLIPHHITGRVRVARAPAGTCRFCAGYSVADMIDAGGEVGQVHRSCFLEWDRHQEALEASFGRNVLPDPGEFRTELELEHPADRAA